MDVFTGQMTQTVLDTLHQHNILLTRVPAGMTHLYQVLDLTVNGYAKKYMKKRFNDWYTNQVKEQLDEGKEIDQVEVKLTLTILKPFHAKWLVDFYNHMTTEKGKGWHAAGITDALSNGGNLEPLDPFADIDPLVNGVSVTQDDCNLTSIDKDNLIRRRQDGDSEDDESEWELDGNAFNVFDS